MSLRIERGAFVRLRSLLANGAPKFVHDFAILSSGQFASKLIGLVVFAMLARALDPEGYGALEYVVGLTAFFVTAVECGLGTIGVKRIARAREELPALAAEIPLARLAVAILAIPLMIAGVEVFGSPAIPSGLVWLYAASLLFTALNQEWVLQSSELMAEVVVAQTLRALVFATVVFLFVRSSADLTAVGFAELGAVAVASIYCLWQQHIKVTPVRFSFSIPRMAVLVREGTSVGLSHLVWAAAQFMPLFLLGSIVGAAHVGLFAAAQRLVMSLSTFSFVYHFNLYPSLTRAAAESNDELANLLRLSFRVTAWVSIGCALGFALAADPILTSIYGGRFEVGAPALAILVWVVPVIFLSGHARWLLIVSDKQRCVLHAQIAGLVTIVLVGGPLILYFRDVGAACTAVIGSIVVWIVSHWLALRLKARPPDFFLFVKPLMLALVLGLAIQFAEVGLLVKAVGGFILYVLAAPLVDRELVRDTVRLAHAKATAVPPRQP